MDNVMLENSYLHESLEGKEIDRLLVEYQAVTAQLKDLEITKQAVLKRLFDLTQVGVNETSKHVFNIVEVAGKQSISAKDIQEQAPELFKRISGSGFLNVGNPYKVVRGIKQKGNRV